MAFLVVGGVAVPASPSDATEEIVEIGDRGRAFDGSMLASIRARKRVWTIATVPMTIAAAATLRTQLISTSVSCSGDLLGGSVTCFPEIVSRPRAKIGATHMVVTHFTLSEA